MYKSEVKKMGQKKLESTEILVKKISEDDLRKVVGGAVKDNENIEDKKGFKELIFALFGKIYDYFISIGGKNKSEKKEHKEPKDYHDPAHNNTDNLVYNNENTENIDPYAPSAPPIEYMDR